MPWLQKWEFPCKEGSLKIPIGINYQNKQIKRSDSFMMTMICWMCCRV